MTTTDAQTKLISFQADLRCALLEREAAIDSTLLALLAGEHVVLIGPPGTGKSLLARALATALGGRYFETLLTRFSSPEDLVGPISLAGLQSDTYRRVLTGRIADCDVAFVDEVFKSNAGTLNQMLAILNERVVHDEGRAKKIPLRVCVAASNELPRGEEGLEALWDRFIVRVPVVYVADNANRKRLIGGSLPEIGACSFPLSVLGDCEREAMALPIGERCADDLLTLMEKLRAIGVTVSDRRLVKLAKLLRASAYLSGASECASEHFDLLLDALWDKPEQRPEIARVLAASSAPQVIEAGEKRDAVIEATKPLVADTASKSDLIRAMTEVDGCMDKVERLALETPEGSKARGKIKEMLLSLNTLHESLVARASAKLARASL